LDESEQSRGAKRASLLAAAFQVSGRLRMWASHARSGRPMKVKGRGGVFGTISGIGSVAGGSWRALDRLCGVGLGCAAVDQRGSAGFRPCVVGAGGLSAGGGER
jgi:hypothetical protein